MQRRYILFSVLFQTKSSCVAKGEVGQGDDAGVPPHLAAAWARPRVGGMFHLQGQSIITNILLWMSVHFGLLSSLFQLKMYFYFF